MSMAKADILVVGIASDNFVYGWTVDLKGRDVVGIDYEHGILGGWTLSELAAISFAFHSGAIQVPILGHD